MAAAFGKIKKEDLDPIKNWISTQKISDSKDPETVFYPFSGPDFLYVDIFYPNAKKFIMIGLEELGTVPDVSNLSDESVAGYLENVRYSLRYINKVGYFITKQMTEDFKNINFDGATQLLLYYIGKQGYTITDLKLIYINDLGVAIPGTRPAKRTVQGIKIDFKKENEATKNIFYFSFNLSDENFKQKPEFFTFVSNFGNKVAYIKSASYLMHSDEFSTCRNIMLRQCTKILQDDSGIPYRFFKKNNFETALYGTYTKTTKDFTYGFQQDLKDAVAESDYYNTLDFRLGYNEWNNETVLMYAIKGNKPIAYTEPKNKTNEVRFRVQILTSNAELSVKNQVFENLADVMKYTENGTFKYTLGNEKTPEACEKHKSAAMAAGFKGYFTVAFNHEVRISMDEALRLIGR